MTGQEMLTLKGHGPVAFSPDGRCISRAAGRSGTPGQEKPRPVQAARKTRSRTRDFRPIAISQSNLEG